MGRSALAIVILAACRFAPEEVSGDGALVDTVATRDADRPAADGARDGVADGVTPADAAPSDAARPADALTFVPCTVGYAGYVQLPGAASCYRLDTSAANWDDAEADCDDDGSGTHLVVIDGPEEDVLAHTLAAGNRVWIGLTDFVNEGTWVWVTPVGSTHRNWAAGEPSNTFAEHTAEMREDGSWGNHEWYRDRAFLCEYDGIEPDPARFSH